MEKKDKNILKYISRILKIAVLVVGAVVIYVGLDYFISDDTENRTRNSYHDFYEEDEVNTVFVGPSHSVYSISACKLTDDLGESVFNLATTGQYLTGSLAVIEDAYETKHVSKVYLEISASRFCSDLNKDKTTTIITDYSKELLPKAELIAKTFESDQYIPISLRLRKNLDPIKLISLDEMKSIYDKKHKESYINYESGSNYIGRGQWERYDSITVTDDNTAAINKDSKLIDNCSLDDIKEIQLTALNDIISYCKEKNIQLAFYVTPYTPYYLEYFENYDTFFDYIKSIADENNIEFWDLNLAKEEYIDLSLGEYANLDHTNSYANDAIADFLEMCINDPDGDYFYDSLAEKQSRESGVYAVGYCNTYVTKDGEFSKESKAKGKITEMKVDISALPDEKTPCNVRVFELDVEDNDPDDFEYTTIEEIKGTKVDEYTTEVVVPYDKCKTYYKVQLLNPEDDTVLYETITKFDME